MAYSFGAGVRPELGRTDYSGYLQGALTGAQGVAAGGAAIGQGIANAGAGIGEGIKKYQENKVIVGQLTAKNEDALKDEKFAATLPEGAQALIKKAATNGNLGFKDASVLAAYVDAAKISQKETFNKTLSTQTAQAFGMMQKTGSTNLPLMYQNILPEARVAASNLFVNDQLTRAQTDQASGSAYASRNPTPKTPTPFNTLYQNGVRAWVEENPDTKITGTVLKKIATDAQKAASSGQGVTINTAPDGTQLGDPPKDMTWARNDDGTVAMRRDPKTGFNTAIAVPVTGGPVDIEQQNKTSSKEGVTNTLRGMTGALNSLHKIGAAVSSSQGAGQNVVNRIRASDLGQAIEGAVGTEAQALRQRFRNGIPVYINDMRQATEMSARGMDSEKELEFYLQSAGSEKTDIITSMAALYAAGERFGSGGAGVVQDLDPEIRRAVLIRAGVFMDEGQKYQGNVDNDILSKADAILAK
jgi:hypothetical protein